MVWVDPVEAGIFHDTLKARAVVARVEWVQPQFRVCTRATLLVRCAWWRDLTSGGRSLVVDERGWTLQHWRRRALGATPADWVETTLGRALRRSGVIYSRGLSRGGLAVDLVVGSPKSAAVETGQGVTRGAPCTRTARRGTHEGSREVDRRESRVAGRYARARLGYWPSSAAPYGYVAEHLPEGGYVLVPDPPTCAVVERIFADYLGERGSIRKIVSTLSEEGVPTARGGAWSKAGVAWILRNPAYAGMICFGDVEVRGRHEPIIDSKSWVRVQTKLAANRRGRARRVSGSEIEE
jgi:hypothetical protein